MAYVMDEATQRQRYGGFDFGAAFFGWLVAVGVGALITALLVAIGSAVALTTTGVSALGLTQNVATIGWVSGILLLIDVAITYYVGGYVAGRLARFDGGRQGVGVWAISIIATLLLAAAGVLFGTSYNLFQQINVPHIPVNQGALSTGGGWMLLLMAIVAILTAIAGGRAGEAYHVRVDQAGAVEAPRPVRGYDRSVPAFGEKIDEQPASRRRDRARSRRY